jgi:hypothetical protein
MNIIIIKNINYNITTYNRLNYIIIVIIVLTPIKL